MPPINISCDFADHRSGYSSTLGARLQSGVPDVQRHIGPPALEHRDFTLSWRRFGSLKPPVSQPLKRSARFNSAARSRILEVKAAALSKAWPASNSCPR